MFNITNMGDLMTWGNPIKGEYASNVYGVSVWDNNTSVGISSAWPIYDGGNYAVTTITTITDKNTAEDVDVVETVKPVKTNRVKINIR